MPETLRIGVSNGTEHNSCEWSPSRPLVIGRQVKADEPMFQINPVENEGYDRIAILPFSQVAVSRRQLRFEQTKTGGLRVENLNSENSIHLGDEGELTADSTSTQLMLPARLSVANCQIDLEPLVHTLSRTTRLLTDIPEDFRPTVGLEDLGKGDTADFMRFINDVTSVLQQSADETELCQKACNAIKKLIDVDGVAVFRSGSWQLMGGDPDLRPHRAALDRVDNERKVTWRNSSSQESTTTAPAIECYVAAPIVTSNGETDPVYAAIYAHRKRNAQSSRPPLTEMHAQMVDLVACTMAAVIARTQQEKRNSRFGGFFPPALAKRLIAGEDILKASKRDVTLMFCDIRGFSSICERVGPEMTSEWIGDVLSTLSECVQDCHGVIVDYIGDELMAMWGAPEKQPNDAELACRAALAMIETLSTINEQWQHKIGAETRVGIGINSGKASVGNTGSRQRFKYGPLGDDVNRASRVQGLTKHLQVPILITGETRRQIGNACHVRRIGKAKVVNIDESFELFELMTPSSDGKVNRALFEAAVEHLEQDELVKAAELLTSQMKFDDPDHPTLLLFNEVVDRILSGQSFDGFEWNFGMK